jgi:hypothetical protein
MKCRSLHLTGGTKHTVGRDEAETLAPDLPPRDLVPFTSDLWFSP